MIAPWWTDQDTPPDPFEGPLLAEAGITDTDPEDGREFDVVSRELAGRIVARLLSPGRRIEPAIGGDGTCGWMIEISPDELAELEENGCLVRGDGESTIEMEWPE